MLAYPPGMAHEKAHQIWDGLVPRFEALPDVALGRMFGTVGLGVRGKMFAFVGSGALIAKVGEQHAAELIDRGVAELTVMRDRAMREWVTVQIEDEDEWEPVIRTAHAFVDSITPPLPDPEE